MKKQQKSDSEQPFFQRLADGARSLLGGVAAGLSLLCLASCSTPPGPIISSFGANSEEITDGQTIRITAVLSDSDMGPVQAGIKGLLTDGAARVYGTFSSTMPGIFTYDISWSQLDTEKGIAFASDEKRTYIAEFIDDFGNRITRPFELRLHCGGQPACEGRCTTIKRLWSRSSVGRWAISSLGRVKLKLDSLVRIMCSQIGAQMIPTISF